MRLMHTTLGTVFRTHSVCEYMDQVIYTFHMSDYKFNIVMVYQRAKLAITYDITISSK